MSHSVPDFDLFFFLQFCISIFLIFMSVFLHVCICTTCVFGACGGQRAGLGSSADRDGCELSYVDAGS